MPNIEIEDSTDFKQVYESLVDRRNKLWDLWNETDTYTLEGRNVYKLLELTEKTIDSLIEKYPEYMSNYLFYETCGVIHNAKTSS